jgi:hypothetical protein
MAAKFKRKPPHSIIETTAKKSGGPHQPNNQLKYPKYVGWESVNKYKKVRTEIINGRCAAFDILAMTKRWLAPSTKGLPVCTDRGFTVCSVLLFVCAY